MYKTAEIITGVQRQRKFPCDAGLVCVYFSDEATEMNNRGKYGWKDSETGVRLTSDGSMVESSPADGALKGSEIVNEPTAGSPSAAHVKVSRVQSDAVEQIHITAAPQLPEADVNLQTKSVYAGIIERLEDPRSLRIVVERVFGSLTAKEAFLSVRAETLTAAGMSPEVPVTYIEGAPVEGKGLAGVHLTLVRDVGGVRIEPISEGEETRGFCVTSGEVCRAYLACVHGVDRDLPAASPEDQAWRMFERAGELLRSVGLSYRKVVCTRIYVKRLLEWYDQFNGVRTPYYEKVGLMGGEGPSRVPASTGIQGKMSDECECFMDVMAGTAGKDDESPFVRLYNPLQNEATDYGSSFARGVSVDAPDVRYVLISGTAAIDVNGKSVHRNDPVGQTRRTMDNFEAILRVGGGTPAELYHAVWYCKDPSYGEIVRREMHSRGWPELPCPVVHADVCRGDLLVEVDGSAVVTTG